MSKTYRALLVGTGSVADTHFRAIEETRGRVQLVTAVDIDPVRVRSFCDRHNVPHSHVDYATALKATKPDIVIVAAPPASHAALSIAAMEAGAWVLCEKPFCASFAELDRISAYVLPSWKTADCYGRIVQRPRHQQRLRAMLSIRRWLHEAGRTGSAPQKWREPGGPALRGDTGQHTQRQFEQSIC